MVLALVVESANCWLVMEGVFIGTGFFCKVFLAAGVLAWVFFRVGVLAKIFLMAL